MKHFILLILTSLAICQTAPQTLRQAADQRSKKIGMLIQPLYWGNEPQYKQVMATEFNQAITDATMIQTSQGVFDFRLMDQEMAFATTNNMKLFGAALIYRNNASPAWLHFDQPDCGGWTKAQIDAIIKNQVQTIILHGGNLYSTWEVINEPLSPGGNGCWSTLMGGQDIMIATATKYARDVSNVPILINEALGRDGVTASIVDGLIALVGRVKALGGFVDALGSECHLRAQILKPTYVDELKYFLTQSATNHLGTQITEMDVYQGDPGNFLTPYANQKQIFYNVALQFINDLNCTNFSTWGLTDKYTWLSATLPLANPLLFDTNYAKKPAYYGILSALQDSTAYKAQCLSLGFTPMDDVTWRNYSFTQSCYTNTATAPSFSGQQEWAPR